MAKTSNSWKYTSIWKVQNPSSSGRQRLWGQRDLRSKSGFGHFRTYVTWSKMGRILPMFEALPRFPGDVGLKSQVFKDFIRPCMIWPLPTALISSAPRPSHLSLCFSRTGLLAPESSSTWRFVHMLFHPWQYQRFRLQPNAILLGISLMASPAPRLNLTSFLDALLPVLFLRIYHDCYSLLSWEGIFELTPTRT